MAFKIRLATKQKKRAFAKYLQRANAVYLERLNPFTEGGPMLQDADKQAPEEADQKPASKTLQIGFVCPEAFEPAAFFVVAMDKEGRDFVNTTNQPHLALHLATIGIKFASKMAVEHIQNEKRSSSLIVKAPAGVVPPWPGPAGRG